MIFLRLVGLVILALQEIFHIALLICIYNEAKSTKSIPFPLPPGLKIISDPRLVTNATINDFLFENIANWNTNIS